VVLLVDDDDVLDRPELVVTAVGKRGAVGDAARLKGRAMAARRQDMRKPPRDYPSGC
jgi:hypothetical protein